MLQNRSEKWIVYPEIGSQGRFFLFSSLLVPWQAGPRVPWILGTISGTRSQVSCGNLSNPNRTCLQVLPWFKLTFQLCEKYDVVSEAKPTPEPPLLNDPSHLCPRLRKPSSPPNKCRPHGSWQEKKGATEDITPGHLRDGNHGQCLSILDHIRSIMIQLNFKSNMLCGSCDITA